MCTVTYLPLPNNSFVLTSNRDESPTRKTLKPKKYIENGVELIYPKDVLAGGTWVGVSNKQRLVCLLNGGFVKHKRQATYKMSRGIVVKTVLTSKDPLTYLKNFDFDNIEPFTLIFADWSSNLSLYELVWDGCKKHFNLLPQEPKIWSSASLYTESVKEERKKWFAKWLKEHPKHTAKEIDEFHKSEVLGDKENAMVMVRDKVQTVSITQIEKRDIKLSVAYFDLLHNEKSKIKT